MQKVFTFLILCLFTVSSSLHAQNTVGTLEYNASKTFEGYNLYYPLFTNAIYLVDNCGRQINKWEDYDYIPGSSTYLMNDGNILRTSSLGFGSPSGVSFIGGASDLVQIKDWDDNLVWEYAINDATSRMHHDVAVMPDGNILILVWGLIPSNDAIANGRDPNSMANGEIYTEYIVEVEPQGVNGADIVWRWDVWDHLVQDFDNTKPNFGDVAANPQLIDLNYRLDDSRGWLNANALVYNEDLDQILLSAPAFGEVWFIDHNTTTAEAAGSAGDLLYRWGNPQAYKSGTAADQKLFFQHDPHWIDEGLDSSDPDWGKIAVFNNRVGADFSAVSIFTPVFNETTGEYEKNSDGTFAPEDFEYTYQSPTPQDMYSDILSSVQKLPNGNLLISSGNQAYAFELTPDEEVVWYYKNPISTLGPITQGETLNSSAMFRFNRYAPNHPALAGRDLTPGDYVELEPDTTLCYEQTVGIADEFVQFLEVSPNPAHDILQISLDQPMYKIEFFNLQAKPILTVFDQGNEAAVNIQHIPDGIYLLKVNDRAAGKIIKR